MSRPGDWGDPSPSDLDDVAPSNPTSGFQERDYTVNFDDKSKDVSGQLPRRATPNLQQPNVEKDKRLNFVGIILSEGDGKGVYNVLRQDGFTGIGLLHGDDQRYAKYRPGDHVDMSASQIPNQWLIAGHPRNTEYSSIDVYNGEVVGPTNTIKDIEFNMIDTLTGDDLVLDDGEVKILRDAGGLYEIHYTVILAMSTPEDLTSKDATVKVGHNCDSDITESVSKIVFDRKVGFRAKTDSEGCSTLITLQAGETDYLLQQPSGGGKVVWTNEPWVNSALRVGTGVPQGWVKIVCTAAGELWLGHGLKNQKLLFPDNDPEAVSHLYVSGLSADKKAVKLKWAPTPGCGKIEFTDYYGVKKTWIVERGMIMSGPDINKCAEYDPVVINEPKRKIWECDNDPLPG